MYAVQVHARLYPNRERVTRYLHFETYNSAANCIFCLNGREPGELSPEDYFDAGKLYSEPRGEVLNRDSIETDWVLHFNEKTIK